MKKIVATVILYDPNIDILKKNILTYIEFVEKLFIVDNTDNNLKYEELKFKVLDFFSNVVYINNKINLGIAKALNIACKEAIRFGADWILTMDQDSSFFDFEKYLQCSKNIIKKEDNIGIITLNHTHDISKVNYTSINPCSFIEKDIVITSGNLLNLKAYVDVKGFDDSLFIDLVDFDMSHKLTLNNYKIFMFQNLYIEHTIGKIFRRKNFFTGKVREKIEHNPQRVYYKARNRLYLSKKYSKRLPKEYGVCKTINIIFIRNLLKIFLYEDKKLLKINAKLIALYHFFINKMGRYDI